MFKTCRICGEYKPLTEFYAQKGMRDGHRNECRTCFVASRKQRYETDDEHRARMIANAKRWQQANPDRVNETQRRNRAKPERKMKEREGHLLRKYGLTNARYEAMLEAQGGVCAICGRPPSEDRKFDVDHDHETGLVRKILCRPCNHALGLLQEKREVVSAAAGYLMSFEDPELDERVRARARALRV